MIMAESRKLVIVGLGTGGLHSIRSAQRHDRAVDITVIERRSYDMFSPCGLPYAVGKQVESFEALKHTIPSTRRLHKLLSHEAILINRDKKSINVKNLENGEIQEIVYDKLILAMGSRPRYLNIPGAKELQGKGVHVVSNPENARRLREHAEKSKNALIIGGGAIGLEIASALRELGLNVGVTKKSLPAFPRSLDPDMSEIVSDYIQSQGCIMYFGKRIESINGKDTVESVTIDGDIIPADIVVMAVGVEPEISLAEMAGLAIEKNAIITNEYMQTSDPDIFAVGECALTFSGIDGTQIKINLATTAYKQALIGGANAAGARERYSGALGTFVSYVGELAVASTGFNTETAIDHGFEAISGRANLRNKPEWMPGAVDISVKVVADLDSGRIIGGQAIGEEGAAWRVNMIAMAIKERITLKDFSEIELAYCPAVSELYDPLQAAVDVAIRRMERNRG
jgi:NADH oxidase (H2O2-forming)